MAEKKEKKEEKDSDFVLKTNTDGVLFSNPKLGEENTVAIIKLSNPTKDKYLFKIKCTSNDLFKIKLPVGWILSNETIEIPVFHMSGKSVPDNTKQYFAIYYSKAADGDEKEPRKAWENKKSEGCKRLYISFAKPIVPVSKKESKEKEAKKEETKEKEKKDDKTKTEEVKKEGKDEKKEEKEEEKKEEKKEEGDKK